MKRFDALFPSLPKAAEVGLAVLLALSGCSQKEAPIQALEPGPETACALDGMLLADFPGPKGQIRYDTGVTDFFCDTMELVSIYLRPESQRRIQGIFVQDMAQADWNHPTGHWIDARQAFYVLGSNMPGSMGPTLASFAKAADAQAFAAKHGGKVLRFSEITWDMVRLDGGVLRDKGM